MSCRDGESGLRPVAFTRKLLFLDTVDVEVTFVPARLRTNLGKESYLAVFVDVYFEGHVRVGVVHSAAAALHAVGATMGAIRSDAPGIGGVELPTVLAEIAALEILKKYRIAPVHCHVGTMDVILVGVVRCCHRINMVERHLVWTAHGVIGVADPVQAVAAIEQAQRVMVGNGACRVDKRVAVDICQPTAVAEHSHADGVAHRTGNHAPDNAEGWTVISICPRVFQP